MASSREASPLRCRLADSSDLDACLAVYASARRFMAERGNGAQWGSAWPPKSVVAADIEARRLWVAQRPAAVPGADAVCGCFAVCEGDEPAYARIDGVWADSGPYVTLHRVASDGTRQGLLAAAVKTAGRFSPHIRVDTHADNAPMRRKLAQLGFSERGVVLLDDGSERIAFERP
ncbi:N-acetyltransferase [Atopobiaceae bacterium 24-176]